MSINTNPNRVLAGRKGAGQFDFKRNSEQDLELEDTPVMETQVEESAPEQAPVGSFRQDQIRASMQRIARRVGDPVLAQMCERLNRKSLLTGLAAEEKITLSILNEEKDRRALKQAKAAAAFVPQPVVLAPEDVSPQEPFTYGVDGSPSLLESESYHRAVEAIRDAHTTEAMGYALKRFLGDRGPVLGFDTPKIDLERTRDVALTSACLFAKYPAINAGVSIKQIKNSKTTAQATANRKRGETKWSNLMIEVSSGKLKTSSKLAPNFEEAKAHNWHHVTSDDITPMRYAVTHEFGHLLEYSAPVTIYSTNNEFAVSKGFNNAYGDGHKFIRDQMTGYGKTSTSELLAEAFADTELNGNKSYEYSRAVHRKMVTELNARS